MSMISRFTEDRGASAILLAFALVFLMGMAALAIDLGAAYNERRQSQTAADLAVMAGAMEITLGGTQQDIVNETLDYARINLDAEYTDEEWRIAWQSCQDPERLNFDVGIGTPVDFQPIQEPSAWGSGTLECISQVSSYFRVRIPDQLVETAFAKVIGIDQVATNADAVAKLESEPAQAAVLPFGVAGGTGNGEICLKSSGSGTAEPPCAGPSGGGFGTINSEFFGDFFPPPSCGNPGHPELKQNVALGIDHAVGEWPEEDAIYEGVSLGDPHPGNVIGAYRNIGYDACDLSGGSVVPEIPGHVTPPNALLVDTGFDANDVKAGLVSNQTFQGQNSRLQQGTNLRRIVTDKNTDYSLDNKGLWDYLNSDNPPIGGSGDACDGSAYAGLTLEEKVAQMDECLEAYPAGLTTDLFDPSIEFSPRFVWSPEYWHDADTSGARWQPIYKFRLIFIGGTYFNCNAGGCGMVFYPDLAETDPLCVPQGSGCKAVSLDQLSGWLLPTESVPVDAIPPYPGASTDFVPTLFK